MRAPFRLLVTIVCGVSTFYFVFWMGAALISVIELPPVVAKVGALPVAVVVMRFVWMRTAALQYGLGTSILLGAVVTGGIGFAGGFFGPIVFSPGSNQGPLLGLFMTGPLGFVLGALGGGVDWFVRRRRARVPSDVARP